MKTILVIDDDQYINNMLKERLHMEEYKVYQAFSGTEALLVLQNLTPDLILLDLMLPGLTGEEVLPKIKGIPVIVLSAKDDMNNKVDLLLNGAVDYVTKPFNIDELIARIKIQLRNKKSDDNIIKFNEISLDINAHTVYVNNELVKLTRTEYSILKILMINANQVVAKLTILDRIMDDTPDCNEDSLKIHIHNLRKKLNTLIGKDYIKAIWGIGFMLTDKS